MTSGLGRSRYTQRLVAMPVAPASATASANASTPVTPRGAGRPRLANASRGACIRPRCPLAVHWRNRLAAGGCGHRRIRRRFKRLTRGPPRMGACLRHCRNLDDRDRQHHRRVRGHGAGPSGTFVAWHAGHWRVMVVHALPDTAIQLRGSHVPLPAAWATTRSSGSRAARSTPPAPRSVCSTMDTFCLKASSTPRRAPSGACLRGPPAREGSASTPPPPERCNRSCADDIT